MNWVPLRYTNFLFHLIVSYFVRVQLDILFVGINTDDVLFKKTGLIGLVPLTRIAFSYSL